MSRRKADPVDVAFERWYALDDTGKARFADMLRTTERILEKQGQPAPKPRQRKVRLDASQEALAAMRAERRAPIDATKPTPNTTFG